jgi:hypothetical protein
MPIPLLCGHFRSSTSNGVYLVRDDPRANVASLDGVLYAKMGGLTGRANGLGGAE